MSKPITFATKISNSKSDYVYLVNGTHESIEYWCMIQVDKLKLELFKRRIGGQMHVQDYGKILDWGYGCQPPAKRNLKLH